MPNFIELIGYGASILVALSLMMSSLFRLRLIGLAGAIAFVTYALFIEAYPIVIVNSIIIVIHLFYLTRMITSKEYFELLEVDSHSAYLRYFLEFHKEEIKKFFPDYRFAPSERQLIIFVLRNMVPAGLFIGKPNQQGEFHIYLDFVIPTYRDFKIGNYLFYKSSFFQKHGINKLTSTPLNSAHASYLQRMGFKQEADQNGTPICTLSLQN